MAKKDKSTSFLGALIKPLFSEGVKTHLINFMKGKAVTFALKKILGSAAMGGFKAWLIKYIVSELFEEIVEPMMKLGFRKVGYVYNVIEGKRTLEKIENAQNVEDWRDSIRNS